MEPRAALTVTDVRAACARAAADAGVRPGRVERVAATGSTSSDLRALAQDRAWPDRSVLVADHQQAGRGRAGRTWTTPAGTALTFSVLLRPPVPVDRWGWLPVLGGLAVVEALRAAGLAAELKWPNDVLVPAADEVPGWGRARKVGGVLADLVDEAAVVLGVGVNVGQLADELPVAWAGSLHLAGRPVERRDLLAAVLGRLFALEETWRAHGGDAARSGLAARAEAVCGTVGRQVEVDLPGGEVLRGTAIGFATDGALVVDADGRHAVHAGDVRLRVTRPG